MTGWQKKTHDEKVKDKLVKAIEATVDKDWERLARLSQEFTRLRGMETKADAGDWGEDLVAPAQSKDAAQVRS